MQNTPSGSAGVLGEDLGSETAHTANCTDAFSTFDNRGWMVSHPYPYQVVEVARYPPTISKHYATYRY